MQRFARHSAALAGVSRGVLSTAAVLRRAALPTASSSSTFFPQRQPLLLFVVDLQSRFMSSKENSTKKTSKKEDEEWIPPNRPLVGDKGMQTKSTNTFVVDDDETKLPNDNNTTNESELEKDDDDDVDDDLDWLQTRRSVMRMRATGMVSSADGSKKKKIPVDIPVKEHTLLSRDEITTFLEALGARNIQCYMDDDPAHQRMGGADGLIVATVHHNTHLHQLATALQKQLRQRNLQDAGVVGAQLGPESSAIDGGHDEGWMVVDCENFVVHLQEEHMRKAIDLDSLWSGKDDLHRLNFFLDDVVDDYVAANPAPKNFGRPTSSASSLDWDAKMKKLKKDRWTATSQKRDVRKTKRSSQRKRRR